jgi:hypothetical protein
VAYFTTEIQGPELWRAVWDRSFYMSEPQAVLNLEGAIQDLANREVICRLKAKATDGKSLVLQTQKIRLNGQRKGEVGFDVKTLPVGEYQVTIQPVANTANVEMPVTAVLRKLPVREGAVQYTDYGAFLRDGRAFFPFGIYYVQRYFDDKKILDEYAGVKFSTFIMESKNAPGYIEMINRMKPHSLTAMASIISSDEIGVIRKNDRTAPGLKPYETAARLFVQSVNQQAGSNLWGWYTTDEPEMGFGLELTKAFHRLVKTIDPYHPTMTVTQAPRLYPVFTDAVTDILGIDPYPGFPGGNMRIISGFTEMARRAAKNRPVVVVLQSFYDEGQRMPNPTELRCMTYLSLIHGANGILYYAYDYKGAVLHTKEKAVWQALKTLATEMDQLRPVLTAPPCESMQAVKKGKTEIDLRLISEGKSCYLLAANPDKEPVRNVGFEIKPTRSGADLKLADQTQVLFENRNISVLNRGWSDDFAGYGVHLYKIDLRK